MKEAKPHPQTETERAESRETERRGAGEAEVTGGTEGREGSLARASDAMAMAMDGGVVRVMKAELTCEVHPALLGEDLLLSARQKLDHLVLKWRTEWQGALLAYKDERLVTEDDQAPRVLPFLPYVQLSIAANLLVFAPTVGCTLLGKVHKIGNDYVGMLVLGVFNAVLPAANLGRAYLPNLRGSKGGGSKAGLGSVVSEDKKKKKKATSSEVDANTTLIEEGSLVKFRVEELKVESDLLTIIGSMKGKDTGIWNHDEN